MKHIVTIVGLGIICSTPLCWATADHALSLGVVQQTQIFTLNDTQLELGVRSPKISYQLANGAWLLTLTASQGDNTRTHASLDDPLRYQLNFEQTSESLYLDYSFEKSWVSVGYSQSGQQQTYGANESGTRSASSTQADYRSFIIDAGYGWYFKNSQLLATFGVSQQASDERYQFLQLNNMTLNNIQSSHDDITQSGWLVHTSIAYQHYFSINEQWDLMLGCGLYHSRSIDGEARISQTSRTRLLGNRVLTSEESVLISSDSKDSSVIVQSGVITDYGSVNLSADKLTSDDWQDALVDLSVSVFF